MTSVNNRESACMIKNKLTDEEKPLIFLHIPKAGGTTLNRIISRQYKNNTIFDIGARPYENFQKFSQLSNAKKDKIRYLHGHVPFGLFDKSLPVTPNYITMLRDPVDRIISHYYHTINRASNMLYDDTTSKFMTLEDFASGELFSQIPNYQTRFISGIDDVNPFSGKKPVTENILEIAKKNLSEQFEAVGIIEKFDESLMLFKNIMGWKNIYYTKQYVSKKRIPRDAISRETITAIEQCNQYDIELYRFAIERFEELISEQPVSFKDQVHDFQKANGNVSGKFYTIQDLPLAMTKKVKTRGYVLLKKLKLR